MRGRVIGIECQRPALEPESVRRMGLQEDFIAAGDARTQQRELPGQKLGQGAGPQLGLRCVPYPGNQFGRNGADEFILRRQAFTAGPIEIRCPDMFAIGEETNCTLTRIKPPAF